MTAGTWGRGALALAVLAATGLLLRPLEERVWAQVRAGEPALRLAGLEEAAGPGVVLGLLGGFRALVANALWLRANHHWEEREAAATLALLHAATAADPRPLFFWINGARMIAYDLPAWAIDSLGGPTLVPAAKRAAIEAGDARRALEWLESAERALPGRPEIVLEQAHLHLRRLGEPGRAAELYAAAARLPEAPYHAARLHAEVLRQLGRPAEAYHYLRGVLATLPPDDPFALAWLVYDRVRALEAELGIPVAERWPGTRPPEIRFDRGP